MFDSSVVPATVHTDETGIQYELPVLLTPQGPLQVLLDYLLENWDVRSTAWMLNVSAAVKLFLDHLSTCSPDMDEREVFTLFRRRLLTGTVTAAAPEDASGLWWAAVRPRRSRVILRNLTDFFNWWGDKHPGRRSMPLTWAGSQHDQRLAEAAYRYRRNKAFLGHTWSDVEETAQNTSRSRVGQHAPKVEPVQPPAFPEDRLMDLILRGFKVGNRYNYRDMLITLLMNGAGFRVSEPFHMYLWDVAEDPVQQGQALVLLHHPAWGDAPPDPRWRDARGQQRKGQRVEYLAERYGASPRDWGMSKLAAGWKGGMHESEFGGYYKRAYWFVPELGELFWKIWGNYVADVVRIDPDRRDHPYAFMNIRRAPLGGIYKVGRFERSHAEAVRRIGLEPAKHLGTSVHGHRYAYGQRLRKAGIAPEFIRRFMHHSDLSSQEVYTAPDHAEVLAQLQAGLTRLDAKTADIRASAASWSAEAFSTPPSFIR